MATPLDSRLLITGATGFVGRHCMAAMKNYEVIGLGHVPVTDIPGKIVVANLLETSSIQAVIREYRPTHLLHLAWEATPGTYWTDPINHRWVTASEALYREFLSQGGQRAVFAGTVAEYEWTSDVYVEDKTPIKPATLYGQCKADLFKKLTAIDATKFAWARFFYIYGQNEAPGRLVSGAFQKLMSGQRFPTTSGEQIRDYIYVKDLAAALATLLRSDQVGAFNLGSGENTKVRNILEIIGRLTGRSDQIAFGEIDQRPNDPRSIVADISRMRSLGWKPKHNLVDGLTATFEWWKML